MRVDNDYSSEDELPEDVEEALRLQDEALLLLDRLRALEPAGRHRREEKTSSGRRDFRRWPTPEGITVELHDGRRWQIVPCSDMGVGGARMTAFPDWVQGPTPVRLKAPDLIGAIIALSDVMWKDADKQTAGVRWEFQDPDEREQWSEALIDALLTRHALA